MHADSYFRPSYFSRLHLPQPLRDGLMLAFFVLVCFATAGLGMLWTNASLETWYPTLVKPAWNPPNWVFGPVWTALYLAMSVAAWLVWRTGPVPRPLATWIPFAAQLMLNAAWSGIFFGLQRPGLAFAELLGLWIAIVATLIAFWARSKLAGVLLVPYLAWVTFAGVLNFTIWRLNA